MSQTAEQKFIGYYCSAQGELVLLATTQNSPNSSPGSCWHSNIWREQQEEKTKGHCFLAERPTHWEAVIPSGDSTGDT